MTDTFAIHQDRARTACSLSATLFGSGQIQVFAQRIQQRDAWFHLQVVSNAIDF
jgi:hypothetical protein